MLWFAVSRSLASSDAGPTTVLPEPVTLALQDLRRLATAVDGVAADDVGAMTAALGTALGRLGELTTTLAAIAALKIRLDGDG